MQFNRDNSSNYEFGTIPLGPTRFIVLKANGDRKTRNGDPMVVLICGTTNQAGQNLKCEHYCGPYHDAGFIEFLSAFYPHLVMPYQQTGSVNADINLLPGKSFIADVTHEPKDGGGIWHRLTKLRADAPPQQQAPPPQQHAGQQQYTQQQGGYQPPPQGGYQPPPQGGGGSGQPADF